MWCGWNGYDLFRLGKREGYADGTRQERGKPGGAGEERKRVVTFGLTD